MLGLPHESLLVIALLCATISGLLFGMAFLERPGDRGRRNPTPAPVGDDAYLADVLFAAERDRRCGEGALELLLDQVYGHDGWSHWETDLRDRSVHVWGVRASDAAALELVRAGFHQVTQHAHPYGEFVRCRQTGEMRAAA